MIAESPCAHAQSPPAGRHLLWLPAVAEHWWAPRPKVKEHTTTPRRSSDASGAAPSAPAAGYWRLKWDSNIPKDPAKVKARTGRVILAMKVDLWYGREEAGSIAWAAPGATTAENHLSGR